MTHRPRRKSAPRPAAPQAPARSSARPDRTTRASSSATASGWPTRSTATGEPTVLLLPTWSIVHSRLWKMQIPYLARHFRVVTFDGRGNGRSDRPPAPRPTRTRVRGRRARGPGRDRHGPRASLVCALGAARLRALHLAAEHPERVAGAVVIAPGVRARERGLAERRLHRWDDGAGHRRGLGEVQPALLARRTTATSSSSSSRRCSPSRTRPSRSRTASAGRSRPRPRRSSTTTPAAIGARRSRAVRGLVPPSPLPGARHPRAPTTRSPGPGRGAAGRGDRRRAGPARGRRATARTSATRSGQPPAARRSSPRAADRRAGSAAAARRKRALYLSSPIGLGHARRDVAIADELRRLQPDLEIDWLAQHPVTAVLAGRAASACIPRARGWPTSRPTSRASRPSTTCTLPGDPPDGRDPGRQLHGVPRRRPGRGLRPRGSATRPGTSTTSCTRTRS